MPSRRLFRRHAGFCTSLKKETACVHFYLSMPRVAQRRASSIRLHCI